MIKKAIVFEIWQEHEWYSPAYVYRAHEKIIMNENKVREVSLCM
ncbi:hypothetical protein [Bacillus cereus]|nr:hypothetical protein [Bacillus cereus]